MKEQKVIQKQLIKNMLLNLAAFTIIFSIFGIILYKQVSSSLYYSADKELKNSKNRYGIIQNIQPREEKPRQFFNNTEEKKIGVVNPRIIYIVRNEEGEVLEENGLGKMDSEIADKITFDKSNLDNIYRVTLDGSYQYRAINIQIEKDGETVYIQMLVNVDGEEAILVSFSKTLVICIVAMIIISILASYLLSQYTLNPIVESWKKQTEFVQNASHELRTPLTIIQAKQELLLEHPNNKIMEEAEEIQISLQETRRLAKLIKDLMILARGDANKEILQKEKIALDEFLKEMAIPYEDFAEAQEKKWKFDLQFQKEIIVDRNKLHQLMVIILDNSIKYTEKGDEIEIATAEKEGKCIIEIKDTGIGVSDETIKHMFDRFYREDKARSRETGGSGLGLSIANYLVELHGGSIKASHNGDRGTIITIKLPMK